MFINCREGSLSKKKSKITTNVCGDNDTHSNIQGDLEKRSCGDLEELAIQ